MQKRYFSASDLVVMRINETLFHWEMETFMNHISEAVVSFIQWCRKFNENTTNNVYLKSLTHLIGV